MSDVVSIELLLDPESEAHVRADWDRLAAAGFSSLAAHRAPSNRPHVTLLVRPTLQQVDFADAVTRLPVVVTLAAPILFRHGDRAVLARRVAATDELLRLHSAVHAAAPPGQDAPHTVPGNWTPHVTLARRIRMADATDVLHFLGPEHSGKGLALRRWDSASAQVTPII